MNNLRKLQYNFAGQNFFIYIFILTPAVIFFSKFLSDLFLSIISVYTIIYILKSNKFYLLNHLFFFFIFLIYISINLILNNFDLVLFLKSIALLRFPLFILFPLLINVEYFDIKKKFNFIFILSIIVFTFNLYLEAFLGFNIFGNTLSNDYQRVTSFFGDEFIAGSYLFFTFFILLFSFKDFNLIKILFLFIIYFAIFLSGDRTPFILINLFLFIYLLYNFKKIFKVKITKIILILITIFVLIISFLHQGNIVKFSSISKYENTFKDIKNDITRKNNNNLGLKRWAYYGMTIKSYVIFKHNIISGTTYKSYRKECRNKKYDTEYARLTNKLEYNGCSNHPHNVYLEILSEQGLLGFILFLMFIYNFFNLKNLTKFNLHRSFYTIFLICHFLPFRPHGSIYTNFGLIMMSCTVAIYLLNHKKDEKK